VKAKDVQIQLEQSAKELLIEKGYDPQYGARPMRRAVERYLEDPFAEELLRGNIKPGDVVHVIANDDKLSFNVAAPAGSEAASPS
jgi:ATP-dependent Clp protease ATP-binding subunit ClpC